MSVTIEECIFKYLQKNNKRHTAGDMARKIACLSKRQIQSALHKIRSKYPNTVLMDYPERGKPARYYLKEDSVS